MDYPIWGHSYLTGTVGFAIVAIIFAFVAHLAGGLALINALILRRARVTDHHSLGQYLRGESTRIVFVPFAASLLFMPLFWFYMSLAYPATTSAIIHTLLWPIAVSGLFLIVQAFCASVYHFAADRLSDGQREAVAWGYALGSAGIIVMIGLATSFMTTPGAWLETYDIGDAVFNPTFIPSIILHAAWGIALGGAAMPLVTTMSRRSSSDEAIDVERLSALSWWALIAAIPIVVLYLVMLGNIYTTLAFSAHTTIIYFIGGLIATAMALCIVFITLGMQRKRMGMGGAMALLALLFLATGAFDLAQAGIRSPYTIAGYLYTNDMAVSELPRLRREGLLPHAHWIVPPGIDLGLVSPTKRGEWVYEAMGYARYPATSVGNLRLRLAGLGRTAANLLLTNIDVLNPQIPPFAGSPKDADALAAYLQSRNAEEDRQ